MLLEYVFPIKINKFSQAIEMKFIRHINKYLHKIVMLDLVDNLG
jgi:hypothetical protein